MRANGIDPVSQDVIYALQQGMKVKDIPDSFPVSVSQARRLNQYKRMLEKIQGHISKHAYSNLASWGTKALLLSKLIKESDYEGVAEIATALGSDPNVDLIKKSIDALAEKRNEIATVIERTEHKIQEAEKRKKELDLHYDKLREAKRHLEEKFQFLDGCQKETKSFLMEHLGYSDNHDVALLKRLDSLWQRSLRKKGVLIFDEESYIFKVPDIDALAKEFEKRTARKVHNATTWDWEKEERRANPFFGIPASEFYQNVFQIDFNNKLKKQIDHIEKEIKDTEKQLRTLNGEIHRTKKRSIKSFFEKVEVANHFSNQDMLAHAALEKDAMKWLYDQGYIVTNELRLDNGRIADVIGYNEDQHIVIIEVKTTLSDFKGDSKWAHYLQYCDSFYFLLADHHWMNDAHTGLLYKDEPEISIYQEDHLDHKVDPEIRSDIMKQINQNLSRKWVYGI